MEKPKDWWGNSDNGKEWVEQIDRKQKSGDPKTNTTIVSIDFMINEVKKNDFKTILEVGSGDGRLIGNLSKKYPDIKCYAHDINPYLIHHIKKTFKKVITSVGEIIKLPYPDNHFDLVYTYEVIQHIHPDDIEVALKELYRVTKKQLWNIEYGEDTVANGELCHKAHNGRYNWYIEQYIPVQSKENFTYEQGLFHQNYIYRSFK